MGAFAPPERHDPSEEFNSAHGSPTIESGIGPSASRIASFASKTARGPGRRGEALAPGRPAAGRPAAPFLPASRRAHAGGRSADAPARRHFDRLHGLSVKLEGTVLLGGLLLVCLAPVPRRDDLDRVQF